MLFLRSPQLCRVVLVMPRRNFLVDGEGRLQHVFESGSEDDVEGGDEGVEDMLRRMRHGDDPEVHVRFIMMSCNMLVIRPQDLRVFRRSRLRRWWDLWISRLLLNLPMRERAQVLRQWQHN